MVSCSDHGQIGPALEMTFYLFLKKFLKNLRMECCLAGVVFGDVGGGYLLLRAL